MKTSGNNSTYKLFESPVLDKLTRTHIAVPLSILGSVAIGLLIYGSLHSPVPLLAGLGLFIFGMLLFSLLEYIMHRYVFHMDTSTRLRQRLQYIFHGWHHDHPKDKDRLAMPPVVSALLAAVLFILFRLLVGNLAYFFLPGFMIGYIGYLGVHYSVHAYKPPKNLLRHLWIHHSIHHHREHDRAYGVSSPLWDIIFNTMPRSKSERS